MLQHRIQNCMFQDACFHILLPAHDSRHGASHSTVPERSYGSVFKLFIIVISFLQTSMLKATTKHHFVKLPSSVFVRQITKSVSKVTYIHDPLAPAHCLTWFHTMPLRKSTKSISLSKVTRLLFIPGNGITQKSSSEVRAYIDYLHIIDNQQTLFELSQRLEPRS